MDVKAYGVAVRVPITWRLVEREHNERAFLFALPQQVRERPAYVACELSVAPESLEEYRKRHEAADRRERERDQPRRTLIHNEIEPLGKTDADVENARAEVAGQQDASKAQPNAEAAAEYRRYLKLHPTGPMARGAKFQLEKLGMAVDDGPSPTAAPATAAPKPDATAASKPDPTEADPAPKPKLKAPPESGPSG